jgi:hypothetical protein
MIWKTGDEMYYAKGVTDPDNCVVNLLFKMVDYIVISILKILICRSDACIRVSGCFARNSNKF